MKLFSAGEVQTDRWFDRCFRRWFGIGFNQGKGCMRIGQGNDRRRVIGDPGGYCICLKCGERIAHQPGISCRSNICPKCGTIMVRE